MKRHPCRKPSCHCVGQAAYDGYCSHECSTGEPSRILADACSCWHAPCVVAPIASEAAHARPAILRSFAASVGARFEDQPSVTRTR